MSRYRATLAYDGTAYQGFQRQRGRTPTIQLVLEEALAVLNGAPVRVLAAGRTDSGVHAVGQVIAFDVNWRHDDQTLLRALNAHLPPDIALQEIAQAPGFHPRFDALSRAYQYYIIQASQRQPLLRQRTWHVLRTLDIAQMQTAADLLVGQHDFATFGKPPQGENTRREVFEARWTAHAQPYGQLLVYRVEANAFLNQMARRMVGMLVDVGQGALSVAQFQALFASARLAQAVTVAPPQGLVLEHVRYP